MASPIANYRLGQAQFSKESMLTVIFIGFALTLFHAYKFIIGDSNIIRAVMGAIVLMLLAASYMLSKHDKEHAFSNNMYFLCNIIGITFMYVINGMYLSPTLGWLLLNPINILIAIGVRHARWATLYFTTLLLGPMLLHLMGQLDTTLLFTPTLDVIVVNVLLMAISIIFIIRWLTHAITDPILFLDGIEKHQRQLNIAKNQQLAKIGEALNEHIEVIESNLKTLENRLPSTETNLHRARLKTIEMKAILNQAEEDLQQ